MARSGDHPGRGRAAAAGVVLGSLFLSGCGLLSGPAPLSKDAPLVMEVTSPSVTGRVLPLSFTCYGNGGKGQPPAVYWSGYPSRTRSFAVVIDDAAAPITPWVYWLVFDIGANTTDIQQGNVLPPGARVARNSTGQPNYDPPCPADAPHKYRITVYALNTAAVGNSLPNNPQLLPTWTTIAPHVIARGTITVTACPRGGISASSPACKPVKTASGE